MGLYLQVKALQCHTHTVKLNNKKAAIAIAISTCFDLLPQTHQPQTLLRVCDHVFQTVNACITLTVSSHMEKGGKVRKTIAYNRSPIPLGCQCFPLAVKASPHSSSTRCVGIRLRQVRSYTASPVGKQRRADAQLDFFYLSLSISHSMS